MSRYHPAPALGPGERICFEALATNKSASAGIRCEVDGWTVPPGGFDGALLALQHVRDHPDHPLIIPGGGQQWCHILAAVDVNGYSLCIIHAAWTSDTGRFDPWGPVTPQGRPRDPYVYRYKY